MNKALIWLLTRTAAARALALFVASLFVGWGIIKEDQTEAIVGLLVILITGIGSIGIEEKKGIEVKKTQIQEGSKVDGLSGPKHRAKILENRQRSGPPNRHYP